MLADGSLAKSADSGVEPGQSPPAVRMPTFFFFLDMTTPDLCRVVPILPWMAPTTLRSIVAIMCVTVTTAIRRGSWRPPRQDCHSAGETGPRSDNPLGGGATRRRLTEYR